nr:transporter substrate-binding domain-containing protein [Rhabdochromatium marinum]
MAQPAQPPTTVPTYSVGVERIDYLPVQAFDAEGARGILPELLDAFAAEQGIRFDYRPLPVSRLLSSFLQGQLDFKLPDHPDWQRARRQGIEIHYSQPLLAFTDGTLVRPERVDAGPAAIKTLATVIGFTPWAWQAALDQRQVNLRESLDLDAMLRQTIAGHVDAAYANIQVAVYQLQHRLEQPEALVFDPQLPHTYNHYHLSTLKQAPLLHAFDDWLARSSAQVRAIKARWGVTTPDTARITTGADAP